MAKSNLNPATDTPSTLTEITQDFMLGYIKAKATEEEKQWFKKLCNDNIKKKKNNLTGQEVDTVDIKVVRHEFALKYFPNLIKTKKKGSTFLDLVNEL